MGKKAHALRNLNFNEESPQMGCPRIDSDFVFYWAYSYHLLYKLFLLLLTTFIFFSNLYIDTSVLFLIVFSVFLIFIILLTFFTQPHKL